MKLRDGLLIVFGIVLLIAGYRVVFDEKPGRLRTIPSDLHGVWVTANPDYSDRYLELGAEFITFGTGGVNAHRFTVTGFDRDRDADGGLRDRVYFRDADRSTISRGFSVTGNQLVFDNQPEVVWVRE